ncbi:MAG: RDD family protein [Candidatus Thiodiazotropha sp.]
MDDQTNYPRLLRRVQALLIDSLLFFLIIFTWWMTFPLVENQPTWIRVILPVTGWLIVDPILVSLTGGTPGHHLRQIAVFKSRQRVQLGLLQSLVRSLLKLMTGWWSFVFVLMTKRHQALHDLLARSVVVLVQPQLLPAHEKLQARYQDSDTYRYPSPIRKLSIILLYMIAATLLYLLIQATLLSSNCLQNGNCSSTDILVSLFLANLWLIGLVATTVLGWRGYLPGARLQLINPNVVKNP